MSVYGGQALEMDRTVKVLVVVRSHWGIYYSTRSLDDVEYIQSLPTPVPSFCGPRHSLHL